MPSVWLLWSHNDMRSRKIKKFGVQSKFIMKNWILAKNCTKNHFERDFVLKYEKEWHILPKYAPFRQTKVKFKISFKHTKNTYDYKIR